MERLINILVIDNNETNINELHSILVGGGNNLIFAENEEKAWPILKKRKIGIILINIQNKDVNGLELLYKLRKSPFSNEAYKIVIRESKYDVSHLVKGLKEGAVDYISLPFNPNLIIAKIEVFKTLYFKDVRIAQLLKNIFPDNVLQDLNNIGKFSPKKIEKGVVLFTDFVAFTKTSIFYKPLQLLHELEIYFEKFDEIIERYNLEKIKTIGDAYLAVSGVTETHNFPVIRATLAALEIRNYVLDRKQIAEATNGFSWDIRIGIHAGPLVSGIIGSKKISFDIWGDTVNIAARAEQNSTTNNITITDTVANEIKNYFDITQRGQIKVKYGRFVNMFFVNNLKQHFSLFNEGKLPNSELRIKCDLPQMDYEFMRRFMINKLKSLLPDEVDYHSIKHTLNVERAAERIAYLEGVEGEELTLLKTAVLFHDSGFIFCYEDNEKYSILLAKSELPRFGYNAKQIEIIASIINATKKNITPKTLLEMIMCDADHDYLGRPDYHSVAKTLRNELNNIGKKMTDLEWIDFQLHFLENEHTYFTQTSKNIRGKGKDVRISELKKLKKQLVKNKINS